MRRWLAPLLWVVAFVAMACSVLPNAVHISGGNDLRAVGGPTITAVAQSAVPFRTIARNMTVGDVATYTFELWQTPSTLMASYSTTAATAKFAQVPDGTYFLKANAFNGSGQSLVQGGASVASANTVTVAAANTPSLTYSSGTSLAVTLNLLNGTGETTADTLTVLNGGAVTVAATGGGFAGAVTYTSIAVGPTPHGMGVDNSGNVWIAGNTGSLFKVSTSGGIPFQTISPTTLSQAQWVAVDAGGSAYVVGNSVPNQVNKFGPPGNTLGQCGGLNNPMQAIFDPSGAGTILVANTGANSVVRLSMAPNVSATYNLPAATAPKGVAIDGVGNIWVTESGTNSIHKLSVSGSSLGQWSLAASPFGVAVDRADRAWVTLGNGTVVKLNPDGTTAGTYTVGTSPQGIAIDGLGNAWVANNGSDNVTVLSNTGAVIATVSTGASSGPWAVAADNVNNVVWVMLSTANKVARLVMKP